jgi:probable F420-dependent oxidoreductase
MAVAAEATERLRVGTLVLANDYRNPVVLAKEIATLDLASGGRVELGLGAGWKREDYDAAGLRFDPPAARIERLAEALRAMKALWASEAPVELRGRHYAIAGAVGTPRPRARPHPPVCIGGGGRRILELAAREAEIVSLNATLRGGAIGPGTLASASPAGFDEKLAWVREAAGARFAALELQCHCPFVTVGPEGRSARRCSAASSASRPRTRPSSRSRSAARRRPSATRSCTAASAGASPIPSCRATGWRSSRRSWPA